MANSNQKTHWRKHDKGDYLGAADFDDLSQDGSDVILTVKEVKWTKAKVRGQDGMFRIATFKEKGVKPMIINVKNGKILKSFAGNSRHLENWGGVRVRLYVDEKVMNRGEVVEGLRFRSVQPKAQTSKEAQKANLKKEIRTALAKYKGDDIELIKETLNAKVAAKEDTIQYLNQVLGSLLKNSK